MYRAPGPTPSAPNQWNSDVDVESLKPVSARSPLTKYEKTFFKKNVLQIDSKQSQEWKTLPSRSKIIVRPQYYTRSIVSLRTLIAAEVLREPIGLDIPTCLDKKIIFLKIMDFDRN